MNKAITRLTTKTVRDEETGCLRWTAAHSTKGYGRQWVDGKLENVHRFAYRVWIGPIPEGLEIDHVYERGCRYRDCVEPTHLEAVTHAENLRRRVNPGGGWSGTGPRGRKMGTNLSPECSKGHPYTPENTSYYNIKKTGGVGRKCKTCKAAQNRKRYL